MAEKVPTSTTTVTGSQGVNAVGNVSAGGNVNITQNTTVQSDRVEIIKRRTTDRIQEWTNGMVETAGLTKLMEKLHSGVTWVTVKGQPGEGKTTAAYMALKALQESGRQVFQVYSPKEFTEVATIFPHSVILLDDLFGQVVFDPAAWSRWKQVIVDNLGEKEHLSHGETSKKTVNVIFVGRNYVLDNVLNEIGKIALYFIDDKHIVYMSKSGERKLNEKVAILKAICKSKGMELDEETIDKICTAHGPHGFPHTCRLFVTLTKDGFEIDTVKFMESPLQFLNQTVQAFLEDTTKLLLFKEMIKRDGKITVSEIEILDNSHAVRALADSLLDSYLRKEGDCFTFHHPSIFDSISFNLLKHYPVFVIKLCSALFLRERVLLDQSSDTHQANSESNLVVNIPRKHLRVLARRFSKEVLNRNLVHVLSHPAVTDEQFVKEMMSCIWLPRIRLPKFTDRNTGKTFLNLIASSKSPQILNYLEDQIPGKLSESRLKSVLYGVYQYGAIDVLTYVEQSRDTLDINVRYVNDLTPLKIACEFNQVEMVKLLLTRGARWDENTLIEACKSGSLDVVKFLFESGATVDMTTDRCTPLTAAIECNKVDIVKLLLTRGASWDEETLMEACRSGSLDVVKFLFESGATVDMATDRYTPLTAAIECNKVDIVKLLLTRGASWDEETLMEACRSGSLDVVKFLFESGATVNMTTDRYTPLTAAIECNKVDIVKLLLTIGASWDEETLMEACRSGSLDVVKFLFESGATVNMTTDRYSPLTAAIECNKVDIVKLLLTRGASWDEETLMEACRSGSLDVVKFLFESGATVNMTTDRYSPLTAAIECNKVEMVKLLLTRGASWDVETLMKACMSGSLDVVKFLFERGATVNMATDRYTPLTAASERGHVNVMRFLVGKGGSVNTADEDGRSPLHSACGGNNPQAVQWLLYQGADRNSGDRWANTPLHIAADRGYKDSVLALVNAGAGVNVQDTDGWTPLHIAADRGYKDSVVALVNAGARVNVQDTMGRTPLDRANLHHHKQCVDVLQKAGAVTNMFN